MYLAVNVRHEDVLRLDVAVDDALGVGEIERVAGLAQHLGGQLEACPAFALDELVQALALQQLHDHVGRLVRHLPVVVDLDDVRALDLGGGAGLPLEAPQGIGPRRKDLLADEFDAHLGVQRPVVGQPHLSHGPLAQQADEANFRGDLGARAYGHRQRKL